MSAAAIVAEIDYTALPLGSRQRFHLQVANRPDGGPLRLPVLVMVGQSRTPRLVCVAGVHGDEHEGVTALLELWDELEPASLQGTLVLVPVANPPAFAANARRNPYDPVDMNRLFPGRADGGITERLAYQLFHTVVADADFVLSMHGWSNGALVLPYVEYPRRSPLTDASRAAARAFGLDTLAALDWHPGLLCAACNRAGISAIEPEIGGLGCTLPERRGLYRRVYRRGVHNLLRHLQMLPGAPELPAAVYEVTRHEVFAPEGGIVRRRVEIGASVQAGDPLASVTDLTGAPLVQVASPAAGTVAMLRLAAPVQPGDLLALIFAPGSPSDA
jgi:predicted deacylase